MSPSQVWSKRPSVTFRSETRPIVVTLIVEFAAVLPPSSGIAFGTSLEFAVWAVPGLPGPPGGGPRERPWGGFRGAPIDRGVPQPTLLARLAPNGALFVPVPPAARFG